MTGQFFELYSNLLLGIPGIVLAIVLKWKCKLVVLFLNLKIFYFVKRNQRQMKRHNANAVEIDVLVQVEKNNIAG